MKKLILLFCFNQIIVIGLGHKSYRVRNNVEKILILINKVTGIEYDFVKSNDPEVRKRLQNIERGFWSINIRGLELRHASNEYYNYIWHEADESESYNSFVKFSIYINLLDKNKIPKNKIMNIIRKARENESKEIK